MFGCRSGSVVGFHAVPTLRERDMCISLHIMKVVPR